MGLRAWLRWLVEREPGIQRPYRRIRCPFHAEQTPSCVVDAERYYCFGCGATGRTQDLPEAAR